VVVGTLVEVPVEGLTADAGEPAGNVLHLARVGADVACDALELEALLVDHTLELGGEHVVLGLLGVVPVQRDGAVDVLGKHVALDPLVPPAALAALLERHPVGGVEVVTNPGVVVPVHGDRTGNLSEVDQAGDAEQAVLLGVLLGELVLLLAELGKPALLLEGGGLSELVVLLHPGPRG